MFLKILFLLNEEHKIHKSYLDYGDCEHGKKITLVIHVLSMKPIKTI